MCSVYTTPSGPTSVDVTLNMNLVGRLDIADRFQSRWRVVASGKDERYSNTCVGTWHGGQVIPRGRPINRGFLWLNTLKVAWSYYHDTLIIRFAS